MNIKLYKAHLKSGSCTKLYETPQDAMKEHRGNILKFEEVFTKTVTKKYEVPIVKGEEALLISKRDNFVNHSNIIQTITKFLYIFWGVFNPINNIVP